MDGPNRWPYAFPRRTQAVSDWMRHCRYWGDCRYLGPDGEKRLLRSWIIRVALWNWPFWVGPRRRRPQGTMAPGWWGSVAAVRAGLACLKSAAEAASWPAASRLLGAGGLASGAACFDC